MGLVIFDCDGTLADSQHMIVAAMDLAFAAHGLVAPPRARVLGVVGLSLAPAIQRLLPEHDAETVRRVAEDYKGAFQELRRTETQEPLYPGMREVVEALADRSDVLLGVATGKSRRGVEAVLVREGLLPYFHTIQTADTHPSKPDPSMIHAAMAEAGAGPDETVMIGDTTYDMEMARAAGVAALGVAWGYHERAALPDAGAATVADAPSELLAAIDLLLADRKLRR